jgi:hypothetical protein
VHPTDSIRIRFLNPDVAFVDVCVCFNVGHRPAYAIFSCSYEG